MKLFRKLNRPVETSIGMFDLFKGIAMLMIIIMHNRSNFPMLMIDILTRYNKAGIFNNIQLLNQESIIAGICILIIGIAMASVEPALFVLSGYGLRKRDISKNFSLEFKELIKPYVWTTFVTVIINAIIHFYFFRNLSGAFQESLKVFGGMLFGFSQTVQIGNITLFANGPIWFILALFWSLVIFNFLLNIVDETKLKYYSLGLSVLGWLLSYIGTIPFCLSPGLIGVSYVYIGYYIRKNKVLTRGHSRNAIFIYTLLVIIPSIIQALMGMLTEIADNVYALGPITYIENGLLGVGLLYVFLRINKRAKGKISNAIRYLGRYSLYVMCIHTVEMIAVPWYVIAEKFTNQPIAGFVTLLVIKMLIIVIVLKILIRFLEIYKRRMYRRAVR